MLLKGGKFVYAEPTRRGEIKRESSDFVACAPVGWRSFAYDVYARRDVTRNIISLGDEARRATIRFFPAIDRKNVAAGSVEYGVQVKMLLDPK